MNKKLLAGISCLMILLLLVGGVSYAWFINYRTNKLETSEVTVSSGNVLEVSLDNEDFSNTITKNFFNLTIQEVTGDGLNFYRPTLTQGTNATFGNAEANVAVNGPWSTAISTRQCEDNVDAEGKTDYSTAQYVSFDVWFRANSPMDVYMGSESAVSPVSTVTADNPSYYGSFSRDYMAGAVRMAFTNAQGTEEQPSYTVWDPNPGICLQEIGRDEWAIATEPADGSDKSNRETACSYWFTTDQINFTKQSVSMISPEGEHLTTAVDTLTGYRYLRELPELTLKKGPDYVDANDSQRELKIEAMRLCTLEERFDENGVSTGDFVGKVTVNVWVEGTDREARRALAYGRFDIKLVFLAFDLEGGTGSVPGVGTD